LSPFESTNFDIGGEYYFADLGYVGLTYFEKEITGFTRGDSFTVPFTELGDWGMPIDYTSNATIQDDLGDDRYASLQTCASDPSDFSTCTLTVSSRSNVDGAAILHGWEAAWVMPLDMLVEGLGFNTSATHINQKAEQDAEITGISDWTYNFTAYYENDMVQTRLTYYHQDGSVVGFTQGLELVSMDRSQVDFSAGVKLPFAEDYDLTVTFDAYNLTNEPVGTWHEVNGIAFNAFFPGATYTLGIRGSF